MVSGIGPKDQLDQFNIPVLADRPGVGQNMWDHLDFGPTYRVNVEGVTYSFSRSNAQAAQEYNANRTGILTNPGVEFIGWEKLPAAFRSNLATSAQNNLAQFPADWPEIEYEITEAPLPVGLNSVAYGTVIAIPVTPLSRGTVTLASNDTADFADYQPQLAHTSHGSATCCTSTQARTTNVRDTRCAARADR